MYGFLWYNILLIDRFVFKLYKIAFYGEIYMSEIIEKAEILDLPLIALDEMVAFPSEIINFELKADSYNSIEAAREASANSRFAIAVPVVLDEDGNNRLFDVGTVIKIKQLVRSGEGVTRVVAEGFSRAIVKSSKVTGKYLTCEVISKTLKLPNDGGIKGEAYKRKMIEAVDTIVAMVPGLPKDISKTAKNIKNPAMLADFIASNIILKYTDKLDILQIFNPYERMDCILSILDYEIEILRMQTSLHKKTQERIAKSQKDYYLREEMKAIQDELGDGSSDIDEYRYMIDNLDASDEVKKKLYREVDRLAKSPFGSAENTVISNYLDTCLEIPWNKSSKDRADVEAARKLLDREHDGLCDVKNRLLEFLAVKELNPNLKGQIICLEGPPGVGKTSIAASLAKAMKRKYVRVSLGGVRDEADIRGHRKTYVGAMPGRIISAIIQAGVNNPLILLDEIDKLANDGRGDPSSALLEVLDPEQNKVFRDHFIELPFDLSDCVFIATANTLNTIPRPLIDRMEIIHLNTYTKSEKMSIAKNHLIPKQLKRHGLNKRTLKISDSAIEEIIDCYTRESGVRNLEREIGALCRRAALRIIEGDVKSVSVNESNIKDFLGERKIIPEKISDYDETGVVNGLAYTEVGGDLLKIEVAILDGNGKLELTGSLGDVMKESAKTAISCARRIASKYNIPSDFYQKKDIHIHVPEGAIPKDGPSAGVTMLTALISALADIPVRRDIAMTGEITLRGNVLPIGGLREKTMAAYAAGVNKILIPYGNMKDLEKIDIAVKENVKFIPCKTEDDVLSNALIMNDKADTCENVQNLFNIEQVISSANSINCKEKGV